MKARTPPPFCFISLLTRGISLVSLVFNLSTCFFSRYRNKMKQKGEQNEYYNPPNHWCRKAAPLINWPRNHPSLSLCSTSSVRRVRLDRSKAPKLIAPFVDWNAFDQDVDEGSAGNTSILTNGRQIANILRGIIRYGSMEKFELLYRDFRAIRLGE